MSKAIGFLFDMDGVLIDNNEYHYKAWEKTAANYGVQITPDFYRENLNGCTLPRLVKLLFPDKNFIASDIKAIGDEKETLYRSLYEDHRQPTAGLIGFLEEAKKRNIPMVVGTSSPPENVTFILDGLDIRKYFMGVVDASMVTHGKPHPEVYLKCAEFIGINPMNCVVFEDAVSGLAAANAAGSKTIGLATSHKRHELNADLIFNNFTEINWSHITQLLNI